MGEERRKAVGLGKKVDGFWLKVRRFSGRVAAKGRKCVRHMKKNGGHRWANEEKFVNLHSQTII